MERLVMQTIFGSKLYGTSTPESDTDIKGIYIPSTKDILMGNGDLHYTRNTSSVHQKNSAEDTDLEMFSLQNFVKLAIKGETIALDMIHTNCIVDHDFMEPWDFIYQNRAKFYTTDMKAYLGYVKKQAAKYGIKGTRMAALRQVWDAIKDLPTEYYVTPQEALREVDFSAAKHINCKRYRKVAEYREKLPLNEYCKLSICPKTGNEFYEVMGSKHQLTIKMSELKQKIQTEWDKYGERARLAEKNEGIDWKALHHAVRGGFQLAEIYSTGDLQYPLKDRELLLTIKKGEMPFKEVSQLLEDLISDVDRLSFEAGKNGMANKVDQHFWDNFVHNVYYDHVKEFGGYQK